MPDQTYVIQRGDTLNKIAEQYDVQGGSRALASYNDIANPNYIHPGQRISIPCEGSCATQTYTVRGGDTLAKIAASFNYPGGYQALAQANNIANPSLISVGTILRIDGQQAQVGQGQGSSPAPSSGGARNDAPIPGEGSWISAAVNYNNSRGYSGSKWRQYQGIIGTEADGQPGKMTARAVYRWQESHDLETDGQLGPRTAASILGGTVAPETETGGPDPGAGDTGGSVGGLRQRILDLAHSTLSDRTGHHYYSQPGRLTTDPLAKAPLRSDCSQWVRSVYLNSGGGDPGTYTGAMVGASKKTNSPKPGDLMLKSGHVELYIGNGETIGHGSPPINKGSTSYWKGRGMYYATYDFLD